MPSLIKNITNLALFDFCETLANFQTADSYVHFVSKHEQKKIMFFKNFLRKLMNKLRITFLLEKISKKPIHKLLVLNQLKGLDYEKLDNYAKKFYEEKVKPSFIKEVVAKLIQLQKQGYSIYVVSGGYDIYLKYFVNEFNLDGLFCTKILFKNGICEGEFDGLDCIGKNKVVILKEHFKNFDSENSKIIGFSDSLSDLPMLELCNEGYFIKNGKIAFHLKKEEQKDEKIFRN